LRNVGAEKKDKPTQKLSVGKTEGITSSPHANVLQEPEVLDLVRGEIAVPLTRALVGIWLDAPDVMGSADAKAVHQRGHLVSELGASGDGALVALLEQGEISLEKGLQEVAATVGEHLDDVREEEVLVLVQETLNRVRNLTSVMLCSGEDNKSVCEKKRKKRAKRKNSNGTWITKHNLAGDLTKLGCPLMLANSFSWKVASVPAK